jgi:anti-sigma factor RsiW
MKCEDVRTRLDEYVDGLLGEAVFQEMELHLAGCAECQAQERELRSLLARVAALPGEITPAQDLWPGVAARLRGGEGLRVVSGTRTLLGMRPAALAAAAAVVVTVSAALWVRGPLPVPADGPTAGGRQGTVQAVAVGAPEASLLEAERSYAQAAALLMAALEAQKETLSPGTRAALDANLETIDEALAQVRAALQKDPGNAQLAHLLTSTHQKKLGALQRVVRLNRT